jgi:8-oxo-dGTP pyrophosphatase MutT (NUDIX family)
VSAPVPGWLRALADRLPDFPAVFPGAAPAPEGARRSAVLILFGPASSDDPDRDEVDVLLTERAHDLRSHAAQVAFPGGAIDPVDGGPAAAALREAWEETALDASGVEVLGLLPEIFLEPSAYVVTPVLAWCGAPTPVEVVDPAEVARVVRIPVADLTDPGNRFSVRHPSGYTGPGFWADGLFVWGFTAGLLSRVLAEAGLEQLWDATKFEDLPDGQTAATRKVPAREVPPR